MKKLYIRDKLKRRFVERYELERLLSKFFIQGCFAFELKSFFFIINSRKFCFKNYVRIKNRCYLSNRSHGVFRFFKLSRICFKELGKYGFISGLRKSSW